MTTSQTAGILKLNRRTVDRYFNIFREKIAEFSRESCREFGEFELAENYFGACRVRGKRGRGAAGKTPVFGLLKRGGKVFGVSRKEGCRNLMASLFTNSICISTNVSFGGTFGAKIYLLKC